MHTKFSENDTLVRGDDGEFQFNDIRDDEDDTDDIYIELNILHFSFSKDCFSF